MKTLSIVITGVLAMGRNAIWSPIRQARPPGIPGAISPAPHARKNIPISPTMTNRDPLPGNPGQLGKTGPSRMRFPYGIITGNPEDSP